MHLKIASLLKAACFLMIKRVTIVEVAKDAGVSTAAVSQALRPREGSNIKLQEATIRRVKESAARLGFRAHSGARSIRSRSFHNVGFFTAKAGKFTDPPRGYLSGVHDAAGDQGYRVTHIRLPQAARDVKASLSRIFEESHLDALIISSYHNITSELHDLLRSENLPIVYLNDKFRHNAIYVDDVAGAEQLTQHLIERGYSRIAYVLRQRPEEEGVGSMHHSARDRLTGFRQAMKDNGLEPVWRSVIASDLVDSDHEFPADWLDWARQYEVLMAYDDDLANQIGRYFYKHRVWVPDDIGLAGYNGDYGSLSAWQNLTTMRIPSYVMGRAAFDMAEALIGAERKKKLAARKFTPRLIEGKSTR